MVDAAYADLAHERAATDAMLAEHPNLGERFREGRYRRQELLVHRIEEYARHCGHTDLLRECIDGNRGKPGRLELGAMLLNPTRVREFAEVLGAAGARQIRRPCRGVASFPAVLHLEAPGVTRDELVVRFDPRSPTAPSAARAAAEPCPRFASRGKSGCRRRHRAREGSFVAWATHE